MVNVINNCFVLSPGIRTDESLTGDDITWSTQKKNHMTAFKWKGDTGGIITEGFGGFNFEWRVFSMT